MSDAARTLAGPEGPGAMSSGRGARALLVAAAAAFCAPMFWHPLGFASGDPYRDNDWFADHVFARIALDTWASERVLPLRTQLLGGGFPMAAHPFDETFSLAFLPSLLFGQVIGVKVTLLLLVLAGGFGVRALLRQAGAGEPAATLGAIGFAWTGWLPSMMLVGFYPQAFYMLSPAILSLLLDPRRRWITWLLAAGAWALLAQRGGHAAPAVGVFLLAGVLAAPLGDGRPARRLGAPAALMGLLCAAGAAALVRHGFPAEAAISGGCALVLLVGVRRHLLDRGAALLRLVGAGLAALVLAVGKLAAVAWLLGAGVYAHDQLGTPSRWEVPRARPGERIPDGLGAPSDGSEDEAAWDSVGDAVRGMLWRAPDQGRYAVFDPPHRFDSVPESPARHTAVDEYDWLGLTPTLLVLAAIGTVGRGRGGWLALTLLFGLVCGGRHVPLDPRFLLLRGVPLFDHLFQEIKYFSFFVALGVSVLAGLGWQALLDRDRRALWLAPLLLWPLVHNASAWEVRFRDRWPPGYAVQFPPTDGLLQVGVLGNRSWLALPRSERRARQRAFALTELERPSALREWDNVTRGVATVDWYATLELPTQVEPDLYAMLDGRLVPNPAARGDAWILGAGNVAGARLGAHRVEADVSAERPSRVVFAQDWLPGFVCELGLVHNHGGLLAVDVPVGEHAVRLDYRPTRLIAGYAASGLAWSLWALAVAVSVRQLRAARRVGSAPPAGVARLVGASALP